MREGASGAGRPTLPGEAAAALAVVAVYSLHLGNGFVYDDHLLVLQQRAVGSLADLAQVVSRAHYTGLPYFRPLTQLSYALQKTLFGSNPLPFHAVNALGAGILFLAVRRFFSLAAFGLSRSRALVTALLFCLHPAVSSCVYPVAGFETILAGILMTATLIFFAGRGRRNLLLAALFFLLSLLAKEQAVLLPAAMVLLDLFGLSASSPGRSAAAWLRRYAPFLTLAALYGLLRFRHFGGGDIGSWNPDAVRMLLMSYAYALQTSAAPFLSLHYEPQAGDWFSLPRLLLAAGALAVLAGLGRPWRLPEGKSPLFFLGLFAVAVLPTANLVTQETPFSERYVFTALFALTGFASTALAAVPPGSAGRLPRGCAVLLLVVWAGISLHRGSSFRNDEVFSRQWMKTSLRHPGPRLLYGNVLIRRGDVEGARAHLEEAVRVNPEHAQTRNSLGVVYEALGRRMEAEREFREALRIYPLYAEAHFNLGLHFAGRGDVERAASAMEEVLEINPLHAEAMYRLGLLRARQDRVAEAAELLTRVLQVDPEHARARETLRGLVEQNP